MNEADEEQVELRLLSDPAFGEELDILVDEIALRYAAGGFQGEEKEQVRKRFLRAPERQNKVKFMYELLHQTGNLPVEKPVESSTTGKTVPKRGLFERLRALWKKNPQTLSFAVTMAVLVLVVGVILLTRLNQPQSTYTVASLQITDTERGSQTASNEIRAVKFPPGTTELQIPLMLPVLEAQPKTYRAEIIPSSASRTVTVVTQDDHSVTVQVPTTDLKPDRYAIRLFAIYPDGREQRIPGSYQFRVE